MEARERLIVALDVSTAAEAHRIVTSIGDAVCPYKVGKQLFTAEGPKFVRELAATGHKVFLDLKFHDIPNTVAAAVKQAAQMGVSMLTVHASGGAAMLKAAVEAGASSARPPMILAVTVLTSLTQADLPAIGVSGTLQEQVLRLASLATSQGCQGIVTSAQEARGVREKFGPKLAIVIPGVRPAGEDQGDQVRVATPAEAIAAGASYIVVGRPITGAKDPVAAAKAILQEIEGPVHAGR